MIRIKEEWLNVEDQPRPERIVLPAGVYPFEVKQATAGTSKAGNSMITLQLSVSGKDAAATVYDYLVGMQSTFFKVKNFCESVGIASLLVKDGVLDPEDIVGRKGACKLSIEPEQDGYPEKNVVEFYEVRQFDPKDDDDLPF